LLVLSSPDSCTTLISLLVVFLYLIHPQRLFRLQTPPLPDHLARGCYKPTPTPAPFLEWFVFPRTSYFPPPFNVLWSPFLSHHVGRPRFLPSKRPSPPPLCMSLLSLPWHSFDASLLPDSPTPLAPHLGSNPSKMCCGPFFLRFPPSPGKIFPPPFKQHNVPPFPFGARFPMHKFLSLRHLSSTIFDCVPNQGEVLQFQNFHPRPDSDLRLPSLIANCPVVASPLNKFWYRTSPCRSSVSVGVFTLLLSLHWLIWCPVPTYAYSKPVLNVAHL